MGSVAFGVLLVLVGAVNVGWGNDPFFGIFIIALASIFFPPVTKWIQAQTGFTIHPVIKVLVALFVVWAAMGVGELPAKVDMMLASFR